MIKSKLTIASCVSNLEAFESCLLSSISSLRQYLDISILPIHNTNNIYSAAVAANVAMEMCRDKFMLYVHQDIRLLPGSAETIAYLINNWPQNTAVVGSAGVKNEVTTAGSWGTDLQYSDLVGNIYSGDHKVWYGDTGLHEVQTVDEIFMLLDTSLKIQFSPYCAGFHFYGFDFCLNARAAGHSIMAADIPMEHVGQYSASLYRDNAFLRKLTTMYQRWNTRFPSVFAPYCHWCDNRIVSYIPFAVVDMHGERIDVPRISITMSDNMEKT